MPSDFVESARKIDYRLSSLEGLRCGFDVQGVSRRRAGGLSLSLGFESAVEHSRFSRNNCSYSSYGPAQFSKRLLRVTKTLVLPSLVSINVLTNSYDVVHSWFIPGLGVKFDCVPGKSTHHLLYVESNGFFYGQCAEICGRYHHHMPIRVFSCSLSYFMAWWGHIGLFKSLYVNPYKEFSRAGSLEAGSKQAEPKWGAERAPISWATS